MIYLRTSSSLPRPLNPDSHENITLPLDGFVGLCAGVDEGDEFVEDCL